MSNEGFSGKRVTLRFEAPCPRGLLHAAVEFPLEKDVEGSVDDVKKTLARLWSLESPAEIAVTTPPQCPECKSFDSQPCGRGGRMRSVCRTTYGAD